MREILFRGKRVEIGAFATEMVCEWVYGGYVKDCCSEYIHDIMHNPRMVRIDPSTVGQYTDLTDRNGKKIFEGDILKIHDDRTGDAHQFTVVVMFLDGAFVCMGIGEVYCNFDEFDDPLVWLEIIGNIHDNPEPLNGGADNGDQADPV